MSSAARRDRDDALLREAHQVNLDSLFGEIHRRHLNDLNIILKTDVQGSIDPIRHSLERLSNEEVKVKIIHSGSGTSRESDVMLAVASKGIVIWLQRQVDAGAKRSPSRKGRDPPVQHHLQPDRGRREGHQGMLEPVFGDVIDGHAEVRQIFKISRLGNIAGCFVLDGTLHRNDLVRVHARRQAGLPRRVRRLRRFTDDVREVQSGYECGISLEGFDDFKEGDVIEFYHRERMN